MRIVDGDERAAIAERAYSLYLKREGELTEGKKRGLDLPNFDIFSMAVQQDLIDYNSCCEEYEKNTCVEPPVSYRIPDPDGGRIRVLEDRVAALEAKWDTKNEKGIK